MMQLTLNIDPSNHKAIALLNYIRTLDFVSFKDKKVSLSEIQKEAINEGLKELHEGKSLAHSEVLKKTKKKYPNLFK